MSSADNSYRHQLNNLVQHLGATWSHEINTSGLQHEEVHTCKVFVNGIQHGATMPGKSKKDALEAAARSAFTELRAKYAN